MKLDNGQLVKYSTDGYLLLKNAIDIKKIDELMDFVAHVITLEANLSYEKYDKEAILNKVLIDLKRQNPSSSSWIYQTILSSYKLKKFFIEANLTNMVMDLLNITNENNLGVVSPAFRFDIPGDENNIRTWHQDGNYFLENKKGDEHLVVWIPMNNARKENGSVIIAPGTHKLGKIESIHSESQEFKSEQHIIPEQYYKNIEHVFIEANKGDVAFINMDLIHSSGTNITKNEVRYTAQIRFNQINKVDYRPVSLKPEYPIYKRNN